MAPIFPFEIRKNKSIIGVMEKQQKTIALGIESSCDDTAAAIVRRGGAGGLEGGEILAHRTAGQSAEHSPYGGVVPEIASRAHLENIGSLVEGALDDAGLGIEDVDLFAAGAGPGLVGGLIVGLNIAKAMAFASGRPFVAVNHLEAHALMPMFFGPVEFPYLLLLISGGHTQILLVEGVGRYRLMGTTIDDACGECFDKVAKMLGYGYMGGKHIDAAAKGGDAKAFDFPRPLLRSGDLNFSFSGLKTAVRTKLEELGVSPVIPAPRTPAFAGAVASERGTGPESSAKILSEKTRADVCASFVAAVCDVIESKLRAALSQVKVRHLAAGGGVASSPYIRAALEKIAGDKGLELHIAPAEYCTDNGVMIAYAGLREYEARGASPMDFAPRPRWGLEELAQ
jgi:N6-L-threonylcarbamoyladenine synthase